MCWTYVFNTIPRHGVVLVHNPEAAQVVDPLWYALLAKHGNQLPTELLVVGECC